MRLLCINPNTEPAITAKVVEAVRGLAPAGAAIVGETGAFGARYIASRAAYSIAAHAALDAYARRADEGFDAVLLACFGDPGLAALREIAPCPVTAMAEASCELAARRAGRFSIVTGGAAWKPMLVEFVAALGLADRLASVRTTALTGGEISENPDRGVAQLAREVADCAADGAATVILGGAGLAGLTPRLAPVSPLPVIDCVEALVKVALERVAKAGASAAPPHLPPTPIDSKGLSAALARLVR
jgi:Asp/Glu/hydantoin racemase